uniref:Metallothionein n=1 Tax=Anguilla anguilla TaxID=7936 RepID=A0A0E9WN37_ANGAN
MGENCVCVRYSCGNDCSVCSDNVIIFLLSDKACWCKCVMLHLYVLFLLFTCQMSRV